MIEIVGAPFDLCGMRLGSRLGPAAIRLAGLDLALRELGQELVDGGDVPAPEPWSAAGGLRNLPPLIECVVSLRRRVEAILERNRIPLVLGGEHALVMGSVGAALQGEGRMGVLWIDAHADMNTPGSSTTGNLHGMPLAALMGMASETTGVPDTEWRRLLDVLGPRHLKSEDTVWFGLRDVDPAERSRLGGLAVSMHQVDRYGIDAAVGRIDAYLREQGVERLWISFDVDALDPILAPGTGTAVRGGLSYREAHLLAELLRERLDALDCPYRLAGVDLVETNPLYDSLNETARMVVEWVASLFGKTILGDR